MTQHFRPRVRVYAARVGQHFPALYLWKRRPLDVETCPKSYIASQPKLATRESVAQLDKANIAPIGPFTFIASMHHARPEVIREACWLPKSGFASQFNTRP